MCVRPDWRRLIFLLVATLATPVISPAAEPIKIASIFAFSGPAVPSNRHVVNGVRFGVAEVNRRGGVLGRPIELIEIDNGSTPIGSKVAADKAAAAGVSAIIGAAWSSHSLAIARVAQAREIPMISPNSTHADLTRVGDFIFRTCFTDPFQGRVLARFARESLRAARAVIFVNIASDYSMGLAKAFQVEFVRLGGAVLLEIPYILQQESFAREAVQATAQPFDVLFIPGHDDESAAILKATREAGLQTTALGPDGWNTENFFQRVRSYVDLAYFSTNWTEESPGRLSQAFVATYKQEGQSLSDESLGYDSVLLLADAVRRAGGTDRRRIRTALATTRDFPGVTGAISFDATGDPVKPAVIMEIKNGACHVYSTVMP